jgi:hypothetical protein
VPEILAVTSAKTCVAENKRTIAKSKAPNDFAGRIDCIVPPDVKVVKLPNHETVEKLPINPVKKIERWSQASRLAITVLTGYLFEVYFALLRFIVQGLSFCQMQNSRDGHARLQLGSPPWKNSAQAGKGTVDIKIEYKKQSNRL